MRAACQSARRRARGSPGVDARADRGRAVGWSALPTSRFFSKDPLAVVTLSHARTLTSIVGRHILWPRGALLASPRRRHSRNGKLRRADSEGARPSRSRSWATLPSLVCSLQMQLAAQAKRSPPAAFAPPPVCLHPPSRCSSPFVRCSHSPSTASSSSPPNHPSIWHCCSLQLVHRAASLLPPPAAIRCSLCSDHPPPASESLRPNHSLRRNRYLQTPKPRRSLSIDPGRRRLRSTHAELTGPRPQPL